VLAAFEIRAAIAELGARLANERQVRLEVRAGIHTGLVVGSPASPGSPAAERQLALGETPAVAERLLGLAEGGEVLVSEATRRLVTGFFDTESLGPARLPAAHARQGAHRVVRESGAETRFQVELRKGLTPLVGRGQEIALALARWAEARDGRGQVVLVSAEAGIGKSRLLEEVRRRIGQDPHRWLECRCSPYHQNSAFYPLLAMLAAWLRLDEGVATPQEKLLRLERSLDGPAAARDPREHLPLIASLLGLPYQERYPPLALDPRQLRQRAIEVLAGLVLEESQRQPVVFVVEDLPWADPSTLDWLDQFLEQVPASPVLALLAFRPEFTPREAWPAQASQITLTRLSRELAVEMIDKVTAGRGQGAAGRARRQAKKAVKSFTVRTNLQRYRFLRRQLEPPSGRCRWSGCWCSLTPAGPSPACPPPEQDEVMALAGGVSAVVRGVTLNRVDAWRLQEAGHRIGDYEVAGTKTCLVEAVGPGDAR
jgi:hypothetical protein